MKLSDDWHPDVRKAVASNRKSPPEALMKLSDDVIQVRKEVASNELCPTKNMICYNSRFIPIW